MAPDGEKLVEASPTGTPDPVTVTVVAPGREPCASRPGSGVHAPARGRSGSWSTRPTPRRKPTAGESTRNGSASRPTGSRTRTRQRTFPGCSSCTSKPWRSSERWGTTSSRPARSRRWRRCSRRPTGSRTRSGPSNVPFPSGGARADRAGESRALDELGLVHVEQGEGQTGLELYAQALKLRRALGPTLTPRDAFSTGWPSPRRTSGHRRVHRSLHRGAGVRAAGWRPRSPTRCA